MIIFDKQNASKTRKRKLKTEKNEAKNNHFRYRNYQRSSQKWRQKRCYTNAKRLKRRFEVIGANWLKT